jgi:hypothetical protein
MDCPVHANAAGPIGKVRSRIELVVGNAQPPALIDCEQPPTDGSGARRAGAFGGRQIGAGTQ